MNLNKREEVGYKIAEYLLKLKAVSFHEDEFITWASGIKSPIYCDNRVLLSDHKMRTFVRKALLDVITEELGTVSAAVGVATGGIAPAVLVAQELELQFAYIRPEPKSHGKGKNIEGALKSSDRIVLIEDLVSTASSTIKALNTLKAEHYSVAGIISIFSYDLPIAKKTLKKCLIPYFKLCSYKALLDTAQSLGKITQEQFNKINDWHQSLSSP